MALALRIPQSVKETCQSDGKGTHPALGFPLINMGDVTLTLGVIKETRPQLLGSSHQ